MKRVFSIIALSGVLAFTAPAMANASETTECVGNVVTGALSGAGSGA